MYILALCKMKDNDKANVSTWKYWPIGKNRAIQVRRSRGEVISQWVRMRPPSSKTSVFPIGKWSLNIHILNHNPLYHKIYRLLVRVRLLWRTRLSNCNFCVNVQFIKNKHLFFLRTAAKLAINCIYLFLYSCMYCINIKF